MPKTFDTLLHNLRRNFYFITLIILRPRIISRHNTDFERIMRVSIKIRNSKLFCYHLFFFYHQLFYTYTLSLCSHFVLVCIFLFYSQIFRPPFTNKNFQVILKVFNLIHFSGKKKACYQITKKRQDRTKQNKCFQNSACKEVSQKVFL